MDSIILNYFLSYKNTKLAYASRYSYKHILGLGGSYPNLKSIFFCSGCANLPLKITLLKLL